MEAIATPNNFEIEIMLKLINSNNIGFTVGYKVNMKYIYLQIETNTLALFS